MSGHLQPVFRLNTGAIIREGIAVLPSVKGDLFAAKNYFMLALSKDPNKRILYQLSMLERKMAQGKHLSTRIEEKFPNLDVEGYVDKYVKV
ncbi:hypothetical protein ZIOFF_014197 [Zingiber officinale]|uniref:Uncharacterized protein n=1 Tax=Zingiber officinale TaxID=94328 RepID=A0A8J5HH01_ZINOF|nr:hypothetical protein ZIOFF_014197 [Zingiber officinale]